MNKNREENTKVLVDEDKFKGVLRKLINAPHVKREDVRIDERKPEKIIRGEM